MVWVWEVVCRWGSTIMSLSRVEESGAIKGVVRARGRVVAVLDVLTEREERATLSETRVQTIVPGDEGIAAAGKCPQTCYPGAASLHWFARSILCCCVNEGLVSEQLYTMSLPLAVSSLDVVHFLMATILNPLSPTRRPLLSWPTSQQPGRVPHPQVAFCSSVCLGHLASLPSERLCLFDCLRHVYLTQHLHSVRLVDKFPRCPR